MPFAFIMIGLVLVICAARGTANDLGTLLKGDFTGDGNFVYWMVALGLVGSVGYYQPMRGFSRAFMTLILLAMVLANKGFFDQLVKSLKELSSGDAAGSGPAGNTLNNTQAAPQTPNAGQQAPGSGGSNNSNPYSSGAIDSLNRYLIPHTLDNIVESGGIGF